MIYSTLQNSLDELGISKNKLAVKGGLRPNTIYDIINNETTLVRLDTLVTILNTLNDISIERNINKKYTITDVFDYEYIWTKEKERG